MNTWALVLAAGEGSRLRSLTTTRSGIAVPKQFCSLQGGPSLLQEALHRAEAVAPRARICTIVAAQHRRWWEGPLWSLPAQNVIVQPENRGTANGLLLPLLHIAEREPDARVVILPSDHYVQDEATLGRALRQAAQQVASDPTHIYVLGIAPDEADPELGYIVPGSRDARGALKVEQFVEKPPMTLARGMIERGGMWNAFILAGRVSTMLALYIERFPEITAEMRRAVRRDLASLPSAESGPAMDDTHRVPPIGTGMCPPPSGGERRGKTTLFPRSHSASGRMPESLSRTSPLDGVAATELYTRLPELDFSRHVLEGSESLLRVHPVPACGWSDLGTPKRVAEALRRLEGEDLAVSLSLAPTAYINLAAQHARLQLAM